MTIEVTKQSAYASLYAEKFLITKQTAFTTFYVPELRITKQTAYVSFYPPRPQPSGRRFQPIIN